MTIPIRSVLVMTKHRFMGDTIVATPLLRATKHAFPDARITLLTGPPAALVLQGCPYVDRIVRYDPRGAQRGAVAFFRLLRDLRRPRRPDLCLIVDRSLRSALSALLCGSRLRAGFSSEGRGRLLTHPVPYRKDRREIECYLDVLRSVAPEPPGLPYDPSPILWITDDERARGAQILAEREEAANGALWRRVGIQPGASYTKKQWSAEGFAQVADTLAGDGFEIVLLGGPDETEASREVARRMRARAVDLTGATKLRETMGVLAHLSLFIGNDTGVSHIAAGLGVPTIGLFGPTPAHKWGNQGPRDAILTAPDGDMERITANDVIHAARAALLRQIPAEAGR